MYKRDTAIHEAGHAVALIRHDIPFLTVSVIPDDENESNGRVTLDTSSLAYQGMMDECLELDECDEKDRRIRMGLAIDHMVTLLAGPIAQRMVAGVGDDLVDLSASDDYATAADHALRVAGNSTVADPLIMLCKAMAESLVSAQSNAIERIAARLMERGELSQREVRDIIFSRQ